MIMYWMRTIIFGFLPSLGFIRLVPKYRSLTTPTHFSRDEDEEEEDRPPTDRPLAIADFAILELR